MARDSRPARPGGDPEERWQLLWSHREQLLRVARRRSPSLEDAEDAVHEALLRAWENPQVEDERLGAWLTTVTVRLCVDRHRQISREAEVGSRSTLAAPGAPPVEDVVCDRAEASWVATRSVELPPRQAEALWLKAEDLDVGQVARKMGLSYRTVESLLARARRTMRASLAGTLALTAWLLGRGKAPVTGGLQTAGAVSTATVVAVLGLALPASERPQDRLPPRAGAAPAAERPAADDGPDRPAAPGRPVPEGARHTVERAAESGRGEEPESTASGAPVLPEPPRLPELPGLPEGTGVPEAGGLPGLEPGALPRPDAPSLPGGGLGGPDAAAGGSVVPDELSGTVEEVRGVGDAAGDAAGEAVGSLTADPAEGPAGALP
ncbi:RNA polymerase sigma factor [Streptomyces nanhaiensis]|uniref:RNA polymerase sigma factor n=1 Tax=Streptomyces nanhaiensis TaxID=679319 RepID=UPI00399C8BE8